MQLAKVTHIQCSEPRGTTLVWCPEGMALSDFKKLVLKAQTDYLDFVKQYRELPPPNDYSWGMTPYAKYPDLTVKEVDEMWAQKAEEYNKWDKQRAKAYHPFGWYLKELGLKEFWEEQPTLHLELNWGHRHGWGLDTSDTEIQDLPGVKKQEEIW